MRNRVLSAVRFYLVPFLLGIVFVILEMAVDFVLIRVPFMAAAADILILIPFTVAVYLFSKNLKACGTLAAVVCLMPLAYLLFGCLTHPNVYPDEDSVIFFAANWISVTGTCSVLAFFHKKRRIEGFPLFFRISSIVFLLFYLYAFGYILFLERLIMPPYIHFRHLNLIPFVKTIIPYMTGTARTNFYVPVFNMMSNLFLFFPIGFYLGVFSNRIRLWLRITIIVGIPVLVETLQYILACGTSDIDDVIVNSIGGFLGMLLYFGLEKAYRAYQGRGDAKLFVFR